MVDGHIGCHVSWSPLRKWSMVFSLSPVLRVDEYVLEFFVVDGHIGCHVSWSRSFVEMVHGVQFVTCFSS